MSPLVRVLPCVAFSSIAAGSAPSCPSTSPTPENFNFMSWAPLFQLGFLSSCAISIFFSNFCLYADRCVYCFSFLCFNHKTFCNQQEISFHLQLPPPPLLPPPPPVQQLGPPPHSLVTMTSMCMPWQAWPHTSISTSM